MELGNLDEALANLQQRIRSAPEDPKLRVFLFQLLCVMGQWPRALNQLQTCAELDATMMELRQMYEGAVGCESVRGEVFAGKRTPMLFGEPEPWLALLIESLLRRGAGDNAAAASLHQQAFGSAPTSAGTLDGTAFEWIADADSRLGPILEAVINGRYYWVPFSRLARVQLEPPEDLRDFVWIPSKLQFTNGGEMLALLPVRYSGSERSDDSQIRLARKTVWEERGDDLYVGLGQRMLATESGEFPLLQCRDIVFASSGLSG